MKQTLKIASLILGVAGFAGQSQATEYLADYTVSYMGLPVAKTSFTSKIDGNNYSLNGTLRSAGLVRAFDKTTGTTAIKGQLGASGAVPSSYHLDYTTGKKSRSTKISFKGGDVVGTKHSPPAKEKGKWKHVAATDLKSVVDPVSATLIRGKTPQEVCNRTIRYFDGSMRGDVKLSYAGMQPFSTNGFKGDAVRCKGRFVPVAGYDQNKKDIAWMRDNSRISFSFASIANTDLYAPVAADVTTRVGNIKVYASRFQVID